MFIVSENGKEVINTDYMSRIIIGSNNMLTAYSDGSNTPIVLGKYDNEIQAGRALRYILDCFNDDITVPGKEDHIMEGTEKPLLGGGVNTRQGKTTGKTK